MNYYYAYHSNSNSKDFDHKRGYGVSRSRFKKLEQVNAGDLVFVIQNIHSEIGYELCGLYLIKGLCNDESNAYPHRVELSIISKNEKFIPLDQHALSEKLPEAGKEGQWNRFMKHFAQQGRTFQKPLSESVVSILLEQLGITHQSGEGLSSLEDILFTRDVNIALQQSQETRRKRLETAIKHPVKKQVLVWRYERNPDVVAEVLFRAKGICESCKQKAPFKRVSNGSDYLEVHHIVPLSVGGEDTVENAIALCPNCHRQEHHGVALIDSSWQPQK